MPGPERRFLAKATVPPTQHGGHRGPSGVPPARKEGSPCPIVRPVSPPAWRPSCSSRSLLGSPGLVHLDVDETRNRVGVGIDPAAPAGTRRALAVQLRALGIPRGAVDFVKAEPIVEVQTLSDPFNPVPGGVEREPAVDDRR